VHWTNLWNKRRLQHPSPTRTLEGLQESNFLSEAHFWAGQGHSLPAAMLHSVEAHFRVCQGPASLLNLGSEPLLYCSTTQCKKVFQSTTKAQSNWAFHAFPSYSRKSGLFGLVVSDLHEAWQSVSTISRTKLRQHKPFWITAKPIWTCREYPYLLSALFFKPNDRVLTELFSIYWLAYILLTLLTSLVTHYLWYLLFLCKQVRKSLEKSKQMLEK
jgi:hypothetical protein